MKRNLVLAAALAAVSSHAALGASEGGDTWSEVQQQPSSQSPVFATLAPLSVLQHENPSVYGTPAEGDFTDRTVRLGSGSRWINVAYGETVRFIITGENGSERSFAGRFEVSPAVGHVDLSDVAPVDLDVQNVRVFVAPDARYRGG